MAMVGDKREGRRALRALWAVLPEVCFILINCHKQIYFSIIYFKPEFRPSFQTFGNAKGRNITCVLSIMVRKISLTKSSCEDAAGGMSDLETFYFQLWYRMGLSLALLLCLVLYCAINGILRKKMTLFFFLI